MTRAEFHRRYLAHPEIKKAELIEGVVYLPSPVGTDRHADPHGDAARWLAACCDAHENVKLSIDPTLELDNDNEPQPDLVLRRTSGGNAQVSSDGYLAGAPELVMEIAASSRAYDMHDKLRAYRRNGIQEYVVWQVRDARIVWFVLVGGDYVEVQPDSDGYLNSNVFPGLRLRPRDMLSGQIAAVIAAQRPQK